MGRQSKSLDEQLAPMGARLRESRALVRPVSQVTLTLRKADDKDAFTLATDSILRWINNRAGRSLPQEAWDRQSFELSEIGAQHAAAVALKEPRYWTARLDDADKSVPLRTWITEVGIGVDADSNVLFGARLICATRGEDRPFHRTVPGFIKSIVRSGIATLDGFEINNNVPVIDSERDVERLVSLLESNSRRSDVVVFALPEGSDNPSEAVLPSQSIYERVLGAAHVFVLTSQGSFHLTNLVGRDLSVFRRAVRTYKPGFLPWIDQPSNHPLAFAKSIENWSGVGAVAFGEWLVDQLLGSSIRTSDREERVPPFNLVRQLAAQQDREKVKSEGASDAEMLRLYEVENETLRKEIKEEKERYDGLLVSADEERDAAIREAAAARFQALERQQRIRSLEQRISDLKGSEVVSIPDSLDCFEPWCKENLVGAVEVTNRAIQGVRKSDYHDPKFIYLSLLLLRNKYVPMRREPTQKRRQEYEESLDELTLEESATGDAIKYAFENYSVQYGGSRRALDRHLKGSDSRNRMYGFRAYFFWDEDGQVAVVGWLPSHLDNRLS